MLKSICLSLGLTCAAILPASAQTLLTETGGDIFAAGETVRETLDAGRDVFAVGGSTMLRGRIDGDLHATAFEVTIDADVGQDVYAAAASVTVAGQIGEDLSATAFTLRIEPSARIGGNARLAAASVTMEAPVDGALLAMGRDVYINAPISGDARIAAGDLRFGPDARIDGQLFYASEEPIQIPERVIPADRVSYEVLTPASVWDDLDEFTEMPMLPTVGSILFGFVLTLTFFLILGAITLAFMPARLEVLRQSVVDRVWQTVLLGVVGLSLLFGSVVVTALTVVGVLFVPFAVLGIVVVWTLAYALGAYAVATRLWDGLGGSEDPGPGTRLFIFGCAIVAISLLNFIPFVGWIANYTLVLLGTGAMTRAVFERMMPGRATSSAIERTAGE